MPERDEIVALCDAYLAAVSARQTDMILALFARDARQYEPIGSEPNVGLDAIRRFFTRNPMIRLNLTRLGPVTVVGNFAAMQVRVEAERDGSLACFTTTDLLEFNDEGKIAVITAMPDRAADPDRR
jgi:steroid Delta-isomerase